MNSNVIKIFAALACLATSAIFGAEPGTAIDAADYNLPIRLACLGDSITFGVGAGPGWAWPDQLQRMLGETWDVRNFGHSGASVGKEDKHSIWSQKEYANALLFHPDAAIILLGTNDTKPELWAKKDDFPKLYKELVVSFAHLSSKPRVYCGTPPFVAKKGNFGINDAGVLEQIPMIQKIAADWKAAVIDIHAATASHDEWFKDNVHPNATGATAIAAAVYRTLTGKEWTGNAPGPSHNADVKATLRSIANPGELTFRDVFTLIAAETSIPRGGLDQLHDKFEEMTPQVDAKIQEIEDRLANDESQRMKFKHSKNEDEKALYGEYRARGSEASKELAQYCQQVNAELIAMIPSDHKAEFGAAWLTRYIMDRLAPIAATVTAEQRKKIREICKKHGADSVKITNTPERSILEEETYKESYAQVLDATQKKRVEPN